MSVYASTARFDGSARALTRDDFARVAPSVLAVDAHQSRSARFAPISTWDVLEGLRREGFSAVGVKQAVCRQPGRAPYTKHLVRLRRIDDSAMYKVGDTVAEMLLKNANDGTAAYEIMAGLYRVCCANSLVAQTATLDSVKVRHSGDAIRAVVEGTYRVAAAAQVALDAPREWARLTIEPPQAAGRPRLDRRSLRFRSESLVFRADADVGHGGLGVGRSRAHSRHRPPRTSSGRRQHGLPAGP
jgi:hypothetical protein